MFRMTLWNQTIPDALRGRLAGIEMLSYMSGPLLGHAEAGLVAAAFGVQASVVSGGALCVLGVLLCGVPAACCCRASSAMTHGRGGPRPRAAADSGDQREGLAIHGFEGALNGLDLPRLSAYHCQMTR
jgi:hypothetical protein